MNVCNMLSSKSYSLFWFIMQKFGDTVLIEISMLLSFFLNFLKFFKKETHPNSEDEEDFRKVQR